MIDITLLVTRLLGLGLMAHGAQKIWPVFGGRGLRGTATWMEVRGFRPGLVFALLAGGNLIVGGACVTLGVGGPIGPACVLGAMVVAIGVTVTAGFFAQNNGSETALTYAALAVLYSSIGYGRYSLDGLFKLTTDWPPWAGPTLIACSIGSGLLMIVARDVSSRGMVADRADRAAP